MQAVYENKNIKISVIKFKDFDTYASMFHSHMEIVYILSGSLNVTIDAISKKLEKGQASITFPYSAHSYDKGKGAEGILVMFSLSSVDRFKNIFLSNKPQYPYINVDENIHNLLCRMVELSGKQDEISEKTLMSYLSAVAGEIVSILNYIDNTSVDISTTQKVLQYCSEHFEEDISINSIAKNLYISKSSVTKIFSLKIKIPFREYINTLRISKAKNLLKNTDKKIIDIMYECGFKNQSSFNRVFFKQCAAAPKDFRKSINK